MRRVIRTPLLCEAVAMASGYLRSLNPRLPLPVWLLQVGGLMNSFGNGLALPFLVIYLHNVRGFSLGTAGLIVAVSCSRSSPQESSPGH